MYVHMYVSMYVCTKHGNVMGLVQSQVRLSG